MMTSPDASPHLQNDKKILSDSLPHMIVVFGTYV